MPVANIGVVLDTQRNSFCAECGIVELSKQRTFNMANDHLENYFRGQQVSLQWLPVLRALATEMAEHTEARDLRRLFFKVGQRLATDTGDLFHAAKSLGQLEESLNDFWMRISWGWVNFNEADGYIDISHHASPLAESFGEEALAWSTGLLEGFYQTVFHVLGASDSMVAREVDSPRTGMDVHLHFGRLDK